MLPGLPSLLLRASREEIDLKPYYKSKKTPCRYCEYKSICSFNMGGCENKYNYIDKKSKEEILEKIKNERFIK